MSSTPPNPFGPADPVNPDEGEPTPPAAAKDGDPAEPGDAADSAIPDAEVDGDIEDTGLAEG